ncbi:MAG: 4Fe-4S binding protein [Victivallaceae bacterium]
MSDELKPNPDEARKLSRRSFLKICGVSAMALGGSALVLKRRQFVETVWQLDPEKCIQCGRCATACILAQSAVKCVHCFARCGYCDLCSGYFVQKPVALDTGAENQLCPTGALKRTFIEDPYFQYTINEKLCIGCGRCVKGCAAFGNGSLFLQIRHDRCRHCNQCAIATACPADAFKRVPATNPYLMKTDVGGK